MVTTRTAEEINPACPSLTAPSAEPQNGMRGRMDIVNGSSKLETLTMPMTTHSQNRKETVGAKKCVLSPNHSVKLATWNVQTLNDTAKGVKLAKEMDGYKNVVLGVAECRYIRSNHVRIEDKEVLYSGRQDGRQYQGVA